MRRSLVLKVTVSIRESEYSAMNDDQVDILITHVKMHTMDAVTEIASWIETKYGHLGIVAQAEGEK